MAQIVLRRVWANHARSQVRAKADCEQRQAAWEHEQSIQNVIWEVVVRPGPDLDLAHAATQFEREDHVGFCVAVSSFQVLLIYSKQFKLLLCWLANSEKLIMAMRFQARLFAVSRNNTVRWF